MRNIFIGFDQREAIAYHVCANSIIRHAKHPVAITPMALSMLHGYSETHTDGSNDFIYSRFLVPHLMNYNGWAVFIDGDMLLRSDINNIFLHSDPKKAVLVVQHDYQTRSPVKYLGSKNQNYPRKNWSSVILWNCSHISNQVLTPQYIQNSSGAQLHRFSWLRDEEIGSLPVTWNWLPDEFSENHEANLLHWTLGTPCFHDYATSPMASEWHKERIYTTYSAQHQLK